MNIRWKVTVLLAALFTVLGAAGILVAKTILIPSFAELERNDAKVGMRRVQYALDSTLNQLGLSAGGWGNWTDAYRFMQDHNHTFIDEQMTLAGLKQLNINALMFVDLDGRFATSITHDFGSDRPLDLDFMQASSLAPDFPWRGNLRSGRTVTGLLKTNRGVMMIAAAPVLNGYGQGPIRGMVMMGRLLTVAEIKRLGDQAQVALAMPDPRNSGVSNGLIETDRVTQVYRSFHDIYDRPILTLRVDIPRDITQRGHLAVHYAGVFLATAAAVVLILLVLILNRVILNPLARVTRHAVAIGEGKDLTTRLDFEARDEIGVLAREFDRMVASVAQSRAQLIDQSFRAGFAELAKGVLHNLGNAMTPIGVRLSSLRDRVRNAPTEDVESALAELAERGADANRRADLEEFVRLACQELTDVIKGMGADIEVMERQTSIVRAALAEQMHSTRNEHVVESIRLPELIVQALEVVPDAARQLLNVKADGSLAAIGTVRVPRTVLRLVLQNLIINAADAIREAGRSRGELRIGAEITCASNGDELHLHCTDDGAGIAPDILGRIFEIGFSTKSRDTNYGIGLHWCANALAALGGRIWATSEGRGLGSSMHMIVPLPAPESVSIPKVA